MIWGGGSLFEFWALLLFLAYVTGFLAILSGLRWAFRHWRQHRKVEKSKRRFSTLLLVTLVLSGSYRLAAAPLIHVQQIHNYGLTLAGDRLHPKLWPDAANELYCGRSAFRAHSGVRYPLEPDGGFTNGFPNHGYPVAEELARKLEDEGWLVLRWIGSREVDDSTIGIGQVDPTVMQPGETISYDALVIDAIRGDDERLILDVAPRHSYGTGRVRRVEDALTIRIEAWPGDCTGDASEFYRPEYQAEGVETFTP